NRRPCAPASREISAPARARCHSLPPRARLSSLRVSFPTLLRDHHRPGNIPVATPRPHHLSLITYRSSLITCSSRHPDNDLTQLRVAFDVILRCRQLVERKYLVDDGFDPPFREARKNVADEAAHRFRPVRGRHERIRYAEDLQALAMHGFQVHFGFELV